jgi:hypothetical protein
MTAVPVARPVEDMAVFEIVHRGARVRTAFGSAELIGEATIAHNRVLAGLSADWAPRNRKDGKAEVFFDTLDEVFGRRIAAPPARVTAVVDACRGRHRRVADRLADWVSSLTPPHAR